MLKSINALFKSQISTEEELKVDGKLPDNIKCIGGLLAEIDMDSQVYIYIHPESRSIKVIDEIPPTDPKDNKKDKDEKSESKKESKEEKKVELPKFKTVDKYFAYLIKCPKPVSYGRIITMAERQEYDETNLGEITCINRKGRQNPNDSDVLVHDNFIQYVKDGLHKLGY